jgi:hypothetical protein
VGRRSESGDLSVTVWEWAAVGFVLAALAVVLVNFLVSIYLYVRAVWYHR